MVCKYYVISFFTAYNLCLPYVLKKLILKYNLFFLYTYKIYFCYLHVIISYTLHCIQKHIPDCPTLFLTFLPAISKSGTIGKIPLNYTFFIDTRYTQQRKNGLN